MKKNIFIVRHGHSDFTAQDDYNRELTKKGVLAVNKSSDFISKTCKKYGLDIQICISSAAVRTQQTAEIIIRKNNINNSNYYPELYATVTDKWLEKLAATKHENVVLVGHNPTLSQMLNNLCGCNIYMQPANCAFISLEIKPDGIIYPAQLNEFYSYE
ncbi:MAG: histidine phosphatase family protein [Marinicellaceae bacterium]